MNRNVHEDHDFLTFYGETPYLIHWAKDGILSAKLADADFQGAAPWSRQFDLEAVADFGLDDWAEQIVAIMHVESCGHRRLAA